MEKMIFTFIGAGIGFFVTLAGNPFGILLIFVLGIAGFFIDLYLILVKVTSEKDYDSTSLKIYQICKVKGITYPPSSQEISIIQTVCAEQGLKKSKAFAMYKRGYEIIREEKIKVDKPLYDSAVDKINIPPEKKYSGRLVDSILEKNPEMQRYISQKRGVLLNQSMNYSTPKKEDWAIAGGIASAIAGPVAGVAAAANATLNNWEREKNAAIARENAKSSYNDLGSSSTSMSSALQTMIYHSQKISECVDSTISQTTLKPSHFDIRFGHLSESGAIYVFVRYKGPKNFTSKGKKARIDGTVSINILENNVCVGKGYFVTPGYDGNDIYKIGFEDCGVTEVVCYPIGDKTFDSKVKYTFKAEPTKLWLVEWNTLSEELGNFCSAKLKFNNAMSDVTAKLLTKF